MAIYSAEMPSDAKRHVIPLVVGLAPPLLVALTWSTTGERSPLEQVLRNHAFPIIGAELFVFLVAVREGLLKSLPSWNWSRAAVVAVGTLFFIAIATASVAPLRTSAVILTTFWVIHGLFGLSVAHLCGRIFSPGDLARAYLVGFAIFAIEFLVFISLIPDWDAFDWRRQLLIFNHTRHAGYYLAAMAGLGIGVMASTQRRGEWAAAFALSVLAIGMALWTGSRGAILAIAGAWAAGSLIAPPMRSFRGCGGGLASILIAAAVVTQAPAVNHPLMGISRTVEATAKPDVTTGRTTIWKNVVDAVKERPLFGYGEGQMRKVAPYSVMVQPHNSILQVALAWGLVGLLCVIVLAVVFARRALPVVWRDDGELTPAFMGMATIGILSLYDGSLYYALPISIFVACAATVAVGWRSPDRTQAATLSPNPSQSR